MTDTIMPKTHTTITKCRACDNVGLVPLFSLGNHYVSNFVKNQDIDNGNRVPIDIVMCTNCKLVQQQHSAPQELLYTGHYWYKSGVTQTMRDHLTDLAWELELDILDNGDVVLDIGSNDGTLLRAYDPKLNLVTVGIEPATNLAEEGAQGISRLITGFWNYNEYLFVVGKKAKVITALGMFYDLEEPKKFIGDVASALAPDGVFVAQLMCLQNMIDSMDIGNLCHEHLEFYSIASLEYLLKECGLEIFDMEVNEINGGSYRFYIQHIGAKDIEEDCSRRIDGLKERELGLDDPTTFSDWFDRLEENRRLVYNTVGSLYASGASVYVYGASTKGNTLLQYYGLDNFVIKGASDRSSSKEGLYTIGTGIPIYSEDIVRKLNPEYMLVLPYAFINEFVEREKEWLDLGGQFIVPLPELRII